MVVAAQPGRDSAIFTHDEVREGSASTLLRPIGCRLGEPLLNPLKRNALKNRGRQFFPTCLPLRIVIF